MRQEAIKKSDGQWVKIRPALQIYDPAANLQETIEDAWCISDITHTSLKVTSRDTELSKVVGLDHVHHYMEDPEGLRTLETVGTLVMNVQLLLYQGTLHAEPVAPPGTPLKAFVPAKPRASLLDAAAKMRARRELESAQKTFAWSEAGVQAADQAFAELPAAFERLGQDLQAAGLPVDDLKVRNLHYQRAILLRAAGWWAGFVWHRTSANCIEDARLRVTVWNGPPKWADVLALDEPAEIWSESYKYGLAALNTPRWLSESNEDVSFASSDLAQHLLTRLLEQPNSER